MAGLLIPVGIHLLSRKEGKVIRLGSLRHLRETNTQQFKGIRLNELVLLALRCLLIILFVLLISGLRFSLDAEETKWVLVESGLELKPEIQTQLKKFKNQGYELHWLAEGFPLLSDSLRTHSTASYWKLTEALKDQNFSEAIVLAKNRMEGFEGKRPSLSSNIRWIGVSTEPYNFALNTIAIGDSVLIRKGYTDSDETYFVTQTLSSAESKTVNESQPVDTIRVVVKADDLYSYDKKVIVAALNAIDQSFPVEVEWVNSYDQAHWSIWLSDRPVPDSIVSKVIYSHSGISERILVQEKVSRWAITKRLNEEIALQENLAVQLASIIIPSEQLWKLASQYDNRMLPDKNVWSKSSTEKELASPSTQSAETYLVVLFLITLLIERLLAYQRNQ